MSGWGWFILVLILLIPIAAFGWIAYSRLKAQRAGRDPPPLSSYIPWKGNRHSDAYSAPSGIVAWVKSKVQGSGSRGGAYEQPLGAGARRGLDPDEAWDARVGAEADGYGAGGYYEEQELGLRPPASGAYAGGGYGGGSQALPEYGEERGRSISRAGVPPIAGGQKGLNERYDEALAHEDPFGDEAERSELRGVSPRPHEEGKGLGKQGSGGGPQDDSPTERRIVTTDPFCNNVMRADVVLIELSTTTIFPYDKPTTITPSRVNIQFLKPLLVQKPPSLTTTGSLLPPQVTPTLRASLLALTYTSYMGIPGLSKVFETYAVSTTIGCKALGCERHPPRNGQRSKIVIDGPSFAYCIYHRLIREKPNWLTAVEIIPSYDEVGKGALAFLNELESYGAVIEHIYFDGYLPRRKRSTRLERLQTSLRKLSEYRQRYIDASICKKFKRDGQQQPSSVVLQSGTSTPPYFRGIPPATFIVPAVLDAIFGSKYAAVCTVVPGEAEVYCAAAAKQSGAIILSNDSDLFVHDLGLNGAFVFLSSTELRANDDHDEGLHEDICQTIRLSIFRPRDIAECLGLDNLQQLAYEFQRRHSQTLPEALENAKRHQGREHEGFQNFLEQYITEPSVSESQQFSPESLARISSHGRLLDPRVSEIICQLESRVQQTVHVSLLCLIEDPARSSAWLVSSGHRYFAYSIYSIFCNDQRESSNTIIIELTRRGQNFAADEVPLFSYDGFVDFALRLHRQLDEYHSQFSELHKPLVWRLYALSQVYHWYLNTSRTPPSREALTRAMTGIHKPRPSWDDIHLSAQIQAVLYSLRIIKQILGYTATFTNTSLTPVLQNLTTVLADLPNMALLIPSNHELAAQMSDFDVDDILDKLAAILQTETASPDQDPNHGIESDEDTHDESPDPTIGPPKKKRKKSKKKKKKKEATTKGERGMDRGNRDNRFEMLFCS